MRIYQILKMAVRNRIMMRTLSTIPIPNFLLLPSRKYPQGMTWPCFLPALSVKQDP
ncbi:unnamed protein product [Malus baccata var. baccata]